MWSLTLLLQIQSENEKFDSVFSQNNKKNTSKENLLKLMIYLLIYYSN